MNNIYKIIHQLEQQKAAIDRAIVALRGVSGAGEVAGAKSGGGRQVTRKKRRLSPEGRQRIAEAARRRWAAKRAGESEKGTAKSAIQSNARKKRTTRTTGR